MDTTAQKIATAARQFGIEVTGESAELMARHLGLVTERNKVINLTRIVNEDEAPVLHVLDSLIYLLLVPAEDRPKLHVAHLLDMGCGAGFPGIPLAVQTGCAAILMDSSERKVQAVNDFVAELGLDRVSAVHARVEDYAADHRHQFDCVTARAVASLPVLVEYAAPLLRIGGSLLVSKGRPDEAEYKHGDAAAKLCGLKRVRTHACDLPDGLGHRTLIRYEKVARETVRLPRQAGKAKRTPLA